MQSQQLICLLFASLTAIGLLNSSDVLANARSLPPAPVKGQEFSVPTIQIQTPPAGTNSPKISAQQSQTKSITLKGLNGRVAPESGMLACTLDPLKPHASSEISAAVQVERLRATASGTVMLENQQLSRVRQQRLQANAAWLMGLLTLHGICTVLNTADAAVWFERAQLLGEPLASAGLAWCEIEGCKAAANPAAADKWIELLRSVDMSRALYLQWLKQSRLAPLEISMPSLGVSSNLATPLQNRQLLASAAQLGDTNAKIEMGLDSVFLNNLPAAQAFFTSAAQKSVAAGINAAIVAGRLQNTTKTTPTMSGGRASNAIVVKPLSAADNLEQAQRYHRGQGVPSNFTEAIRLYQLAQNQGNAPAKKMLELIFSRPAPDGQVDLAWMQQLAYVEPLRIPGIDYVDAKQNLKREPTPLFDLLPQKWRRYVPPTTGG